MQKRFRDPENDTLIMSVTDYAHSRGLSLAMTRKLADECKANFRYGRRRGIHAKKLDSYIESQLS